MSSEVASPPQTESDQSARFHCAFCGRDNNSVGKMIAGPGVAICNECVAACQNVIDGTTPPKGARDRKSEASGRTSGERTEEGGPRFGAWDQLDTETLLSAVERTDGTIRSIRAIQNDQVAVLRERNTSWSVIGNALGISRQSAHERFSVRTE